MRADAFRPSAAPVPARRATVPARRVARPAARQLASKKTGNIGFVLRADHFARSEPFYTNVFLGTEFEAGRFDRYVLLATIPEVYTPVTDAPRFLREHNVDGIIIAGKVADEFIAEAEEIGVPIVLVDYEVNDLPAVVIDNQAGARAAIEHLIDLGHRDIAVVGADTNHPAIRARLDGYQLALATADIPVQSEYNVTVADGNPNFKTGKALGTKLLELSPRPTAAFCVNDAVALGLADTLMQADVAVPGEISVIGFDDVAGAAYANPPLTTVRVFKQQLGELAVRYIDELIRSEENPMGKSDDVKVRMLRLDSPTRETAEFNTTKVDTAKVDTADSKTSKFQTAKLDGTRPGASAADDEGTDSIRSAFERRAHFIKVPVELVVRESTGPPRAGS